MVKKERRFCRPPEDAETMDRRQVMARYGWSSNFLWKAQRLHSLPFRKQGRKLIFLKTEVDAWVSQLPGQKPAA